MKSKQLTILMTTFLFWGHWTKKVHLDELLNTVAILT